MPYDKQHDQTIRRMMPFVSASFDPGKGKEYIESIEDPHEKDLAWAGYYQYTGKADKALEIARPFLDHADSSLRCYAENNAFFSMKMSFM